MPNTLFIGKVYLRFDELSSTNDHAAELLAPEHDVRTKSKPAEGTVIRADSQSAGRGQFGSQWQSAAGKNLTFSVILYPVWLEVAAQFQLSMAVAVALYDAVQSLYVGPLPVRIKWPNDLYIGDRKTAGILIQNALAGSRIQSSIIGIGLNVNQLQFDPELPNPVSLALASGTEFDLDAVAAPLFECLERRYLQLKSGQSAQIRSEYEALLYRRNTESAFLETASEQVFSGSVLGVTDSGQLRVLTGEGERLFGVKDIRFL
jgi:BirA family transcriptional regulator, biotin operon repressor / biotin---[acetyl-CoA-carboxylase] ligase